MTIITKKTDYLLEVKSKYTYQIFENGTGDMTMEVQLTSSFNKAEIRNYAMAFMTKEYFEKLTVEKINHFFLELRRNIQEYGRFGELNNKYGYIQWLDLRH